MKFTPRTEEEVKKFTLLEKGLGNFEVISATEEFSEKRQCDMLHLILKVWDVHGKQGLIHDYILNNEDFEWKLRHFCYSANLDTYYEKGDVKPEYCVGAAGKLDIGISKDKSGKYPDKNSVKDYIFEKPPESDKEEFKDDDIPF